ncbi:MAG: hypothetical protein Q9164_002161 [Protoblastenia rupestris]
MAYNQPPTDSSIAPKKDIFPPDPLFNPAVTPPFNKPSLESMTTTLNPTPSEQDAATSAQKDYNPTSSHPFSAFYSHPTTRTSLEQLKSESKTHIKIYEQDLEAGSRLTQPLSINEHSPSRPHDTTKKECTMWPGRDRQTKPNNIAGTIRGSRACAPYRRLSKKQRLLLQILIAVLIVGAATGLGIGISKAVGSGVWKTANSQRPIGDDDLE